MTVEHPDETEIPDTTDDGGEIDADIDERTLYADIDYDLLAEARRVLYAAARRRPTTANEGRCSHSLWAAEGALFDVFNTLGCYGDEPGAQRALKAHPSDRVGGA